jgi:hypothetical protein
MADDATSSANAQDFALTGEGATDINALDQGTLLESASSLLCISFIRGAKVSTSTLSHFLSRDASLSQVLCSALRLTIPTTKNLVLTI